MPILISLSEIDMSLVYLCLGGNVGDTQKYLDKSIAEIGRRIGAVCSQSAVYETEPWGFTAEQMFLNQVVAVRTELEPHAILLECQQIEKELGRVRHGKGYESRCIDIDIVFIDSQIIDTDDLKVPHPLMHKRLFVLNPMCDIAPDFVHPVLGKTMRELKDLL